MWFSRYEEASLVTQMVKNLPAMQETWVQSLGWEGPLEKGMTNDSSILAWRSPWTEESGGLQSLGHTKLDMTEGLNNNKHELWRASTSRGGPSAETSCLKRWLSCFKDITRQH